MKLPNSARESFVVELDSYIEAYGSSPDSEAIAAYMIELLETYADEEGHDDLISDLEFSGSVDGSLQDVLEAEMESNDEFEYTGEEIVSLLERLCALEWDESEDSADDDDDLDDDTFF